MMPRPHALLALALLLAAGSAHARDVTVTVDASVTHQTMLHCARIERGRWLRHTLIPADLAVVVEKPYQLEMMARFDPLLLGMRGL